MPQLVPVGIAIAGAVASAVATITAMVLAISAAVAAIGTAIYAAVHAAVLYTINVIVPYIITEAQILASDITFWVRRTVQQIGGTLRALTTNIKVINLKIQRFLEIIHFDIIIGVHRLAYMTSSDYRNMTRRLWSAISQASQVMFGNAQYLHIILQNTRSMILVTSAAMGKTYDLAELSWMQQGNKVLTQISKNAKYYGDHPEMLLEEIDKMILRPSVDLRAYLQQSVLSSLTGIGEGLNGTIQRVGTAIDDIDRLDTTFETRAKAAFEPVKSEIMGEFDSWKEEKLQPVIDNMTTDLAGVAGDLGVAQSEILAAKEALKRPGDLLAAMGLLSVNEQAEQHKKIENVVSSIYKREIREDLVEMRENKPKLLTAPDIEDVAAKPPDWFIEGLPEADKKPFRDFEKQRAWNMGEKD